MNEIFIVSSGYHPAEGTNQPVDRIHASLEGARQSVVQLISDAGYAGMEEQPIGVNILTVQSETRAAYWTNGDRWFQIDRFQVEP